MRNIWTGAISFGLIHIPVKLYSAVDEHKLEFNYLRKQDLCPIKYVRVCKNTGEQVQYQDIVRGYEYQKGDYIVLEDEDFKKANVEKTQTIDVFEFVSEKEISPEYLEKPYYLEPEKTAVKAYALLAEALKRSRKVGIARFVLRTREYIGMLRAENGIIILDQMRYPDEIRSSAELVITKEKVRENELEMAVKLIDQLTSHFKPEELHDTYTEELEEIISEKAKGHTPKPKGEAPVPTKVSDLLSQLKESLEQAKHKQ